MSILAIIPARGGSKGVPKKNIRKLNGIPLIAYTIIEAAKVDRLSNIIVSTDSEEIAAIAESYGANIPFIRPRHLATDTANSIDVVLHAIEHFEKKGIYYKDIMLLQPTSPLRDSKDIENCIDLYKKNICDSVISVCEAITHPYLCKKIDNKGRLEDFVLKKEKYTRRQDMPKAYQLNGAIYLTSVNVIKERKSFYGDTVMPYIMDVMKSIDIDTELDFKIAELVIKESIKNVSK
ncbi:cytidylyltransferase domain-containing protein [Caloranaerobacter ferrireducens]|uniref:acylneuraminate cytidylyltransferase family protein n=1 Tax=Caloranaerobacter ferrireducens TaxID=1323370 RepID=UPI00084DE526|nr:acylneuraminate cytidylyltransferase family protein [Caloranaerobacter ferrireducens]